MKAHLLVQVSMMFLFSARFVWFKERGCKHSGSADVCGKMTLSSDLWIVSWSVLGSVTHFWSYWRKHEARSLKFGDSGFQKRRSPRDQWGTSRWWCPPLTGLLATTISFSCILMLNQTSAHLTHSGCLQEAIWLVNGSARVFEWKLTAVVAFEKSVFSQLFKKAKKQSHNHRSRPLLDIQKNATLRNCYVGFSL